MLSFSQEQSTTSINQVPLWLLVELASELSTATNLETLQRILARRLRWIVNFDRCTLAVQDQPTDTDYVVLDLTSPRQAEATLPQKFSLTHGWLGKAIAESKPYFLADLTDLPPPLTTPFHSSIGIASNARSLMLLPLKVGERTIGSLNFSSNTPNAYSVNWRNLATLLAFHVAGQLNCVLAQEQTALALKALAISQTKLKSAYKFHQQVMESATNAIYALDLQGNFTLANRRTVEITGYSQEALLQLSLAELFTSAQASIVQQHLLAIANQGISLNNCHTELVKQNGTVQMISLSLAPIFLDGDITAIVGTAQEISTTVKHQE